MSKRLIKSAVASGPGRAFLSVLERTGTDRANLLRIVTFHQLRDEGAFEAQMDHVASSYYVVSAAEMLDAIDGGPPLPPRALMITVDDAYRDFAEVGWPILAARGLAVTLFVPTGFPDRPDRIFWWERLENAILRTDRARLRSPLGAFDLTTQGQKRRAFIRHRAHVKSVGHDEAMALVDLVCADLDAPPPVSEVLGWDELRGLAADGVTLAPHSRTHPLLIRVAPERAREEVQGSIDDLEREIGSSPPLFAYPGGGYDPAVVEIVRGCGIRAALTTVRGTNDLATADRLRLRRINIGPRSNAATLRARIVESSPRLNGLRRLPEIGWDGS